MYRFLDNFDNAWIIKAYNLFLAHPNLQQLFLFYANDIVWLFVLCAIIFWFTKSKREIMRSALIESALSLILSRLILTEIIRFLWPRPRPTVADQTTYFIAQGKTTEPSFPSGHASAMFAIAMSIYFYDRKLGWALFVLSIITGIFRVIVGFHFPSDIVAGATLGIATAELIHLSLAGKISLWARKVSAFSDRLLPFTK